MRLGDIQEFIRVKILARPDRRSEDELQRQVSQRATQAREVLNSDLFVEVYQRELGSQLERLLSLDMAESADRETALNILARIQGLQQLCRGLGGMIAAGEMQQKPANQPRAA